MGTTAHVVVVDPSEAAAARAAADARVRLEALEAKWSRFQPGSEISRLNRVSGAPTIVSPETLDLLDHAVEGWARTGGRFDPTVLDALVALGYDRDFDALDPTATATPATGAGAVPGCGGVVVDRFVGTVTLPAGVHLDAGGIGKGFAADLVAEEAMASGVAGVCVNVGGDVRVMGDAPDGLGWTVDVEHPITGGSVEHVHLNDGAVVTTCRTRRVWGPEGDRRHHLVDPATGRSAESGLAGVTVIAGRAWWAEVLAKAAFVAGPEEGAALVAAQGASAYLVDDDGTVRVAGRMKEFVA